MKIGMFKAAALVAMGVALSPAVQAQSLDGTLREMVAKEVREAMKAQPGAAAAGSLDVQIRALVDQRIAETQAAPKAVTGALAPASIDAAIKSYIAAHPQEILDSVNKFMAEQREQGDKAMVDKANAMAADLIDAKGAPVGGDAKATKTIVYAFDFNCTYCKKTEPELAELVKEGGVRVVYLDYPILGPGSVAASKAALAVNKLAPERYEAVHAALAANKTPLDEASVAKILTDLGFDAAKIKAAGEDPEIAATIERNKALMGKLGVGGTPFIYVAPKAFPGAVGKEAIAAALKEFKRP